MQIFESVCCGTLVLFFVAVGLILLARILQQKSFSLIGILSLIFMGLMVKSLSGIWFSLGVKVRFDTEHLYVKFPLHKEIVYGWDEFRQVCICYTYLTSVRGGPYKIVICFVKHNMTKTIISKQWPVENGFQYKNVPYVRYSDAVLEELKKYCPHEIVDLRGTNGYYH